MDDIIFQKSKSIIRLMHGDCLERMKEIDSGSVDMVLADPPYGTTACKWDSVIPFEPLWEQYRRIAKKNAAIVLTASQPFTTALIASNLKEFRYTWVWDKVKPSSGLHAKQQPLRQHEDIVVFGTSKTKYNPQLEDAKERTDKPRAANNGEAFGGKVVLRQHSNGGKKYPRSVLAISNANQRGKSHPTQKPVALMEYLIRTYTNEGDVVLDNCMGSGTTGVACVCTGRNFIGIELDDNYFNVAKGRIGEGVM